MTLYSATPGHPISGVTLSAVSGGPTDFAYVSSGGSAVDVTVLDGTGLTVYFGGVASDTVMSGGFATVSSGGTASNTHVIGGTEVVDGGGTALFSVVDANGTETVLSGGTAVSAVLSAGLGEVYTGGQANGTVISSGGAMNVYAGGTASGTVVLFGGTETIDLGGFAIGTEVSAGGMLVVGSGGSASATLVHRNGTIDLPDLAFSGGTAAVDGADLLTVTEGAQSTTLQLVGTYAGEHFQTAPDNETGTLLTLVEPARTLAWAGAKDTLFGNAADWNDLTNVLNPAAFPPNETDTVQFLTSGGTITATGTAATLQFGGNASWNVASGASLAAVSAVTVGQGGVGALLINGGASISGLGVADTISGAASLAASVTVDGTGSVWKSTGELVVGDAGTGTLSVTNAGSAAAAAAGGLPAMALGASAGGNGALLVSGLGSAATLLGQLNVGQAGGGTLTVGNQGTVRTGNITSPDPSEGLDIAQQTGGSGQATVGGSKSLLANIGRFVVGDAGLGSLSIAAGGTVTTAPSTGSGLPGAVIAATTAANGSSVNVSGAGSNWRVTGLLDVGVAGSGMLTLSNGATVTAGALDGGISAAAVANISVTGAGTELAVTGAAVVADDGTGVLSVLNGATFSAASLTIGSQGDSSGALVVSGEGSVVNLTGAINIGTALGTGDLTVGPGAAVHASVVNLQGQVVLEGGLLDPTVNLINQGQTAGGFGTLAAGDIVDEGVIQAGGTKPTQRLLLVQGTVVGGGTLSKNGTVLPSSPAGLLQITAGGTMELTGPVLNAATTTFQDALTPTGTYTITNSVIDVSFADAAGVLLLDDIAGFAGTITTFKGGDQFVITGGTLSNVGISNGNTLTFADSGVNAGAGGIDRIIFGSPVNAGQFNIVNGNTVQAVACFAAGTRIATADGPVAVERLRVGDQVLNHRGEAKAIVWIGSRGVDCERHPRPETVWPVRVAAGAFAENVPVRDLYLSPDHAVFVNDALVPVKLLVNGGSVAQVRAAAIDYYHVELEQHDVILAEGLAVESYLDAGDRTSFSGGPVIALLPDFTARHWEMAGCAPLVLTSPALTRARLAVVPGARMSTRDGRCPTLSAEGKRHVTANR
jgi:collagen type I alpha